ncbi:hypothetical protein EQM13_17925 [Acidilutibacter cellobiosedens]|jgi:transposase InsO family protein|uniref:Integrase catalytic domain-containing protein n=1 Tax=Acidilutibacter cellobiosedens TaxID=2507161 RepID=A0A410QHE9_9FIRM|nr:hypothetical protein EQM13_17925 [Acidilutibacter cellobiosedens]
MSGKLSCTVLRRGKGSNPFPLVDYTNKEYVDLLKELKVKQSMSRRGNCWDNAKAESFFGHYKCESIYLMKNKIKDLNDVEQITEEYMDYYINYRPQKKFGGMPPYALT